MSPDLDAILAGTSAIGVLPDTYRRLSELLEQPRANAHRIAAAVRLDPGLTAGVLRLANSAAVSRTRVSTVSHAAILLGTEQLRTLALGLTVVRMFRGMPEHLLDMRSFWEHSVAVALLSHELAGHRGLTHTEPMFVAGLLHDVGTLVLCVSRPGEARRVLMTAENDAAPLEEVERAMLGFDHTELGGELLDRWRLPSAQVAPTRWHHRPDLAPTGDQLAVDLVHLADVSVSALRIGNAGERAAHRLDAASWERSGLGLDELDAALVELDDELGAITDALLGEAALGAP